MDDKDLVRIGVFATSFVMLAAGICMVLILRSTAMMQQHLVPVIALVFMTPLILLLSYFKVIAPEATTTVLGAMATFFFASGKSAPNSNQDNSLRPQEKTPADRVS
jgi:hypothetical protein